MRHSRAINSTFWIFKNFNCIIFQSYFIWKFYEVFYNFIYPDIFVRGGSFLLLPFCLNLSKKCDSIEECL